MDKYEDRKKRSNFDIINLLLVFVIFVIIIFFINYDGSNIIRATLFDDDCSMDLINTFDVTGCRR